MFSCPRHFQIELKDRKETFCFHSICLFFFKFEKSNWLKNIYAFLVTCFQIQRIKKPNIKGKRFSIYFLEASTIYIYLHSVPLKPPSPGYDNLVKVLSIIKALRLLAS